MTDDPYPSPSPVVTWITGSFIACLTLAVPLLAVSRVKSPYKVQQTDETTIPQVSLKEHVTFKTELRPTRRG